MKRDQTCTPGSNLRIRSDPQHRGDIFFQVDRTIQCKKCVDLCEFNRKSVLLCVYLRLMVEGGWRGWGGRVDEVCVEAGVTHYVCVFSWLSWADEGWMVTMAFSTTDSSSPYWITLYLQLHVCDGCVVEWFWVLQNLENLVWFGSKQVEVCLCRSVLCQVQLGSLWCGWGEMSKQERTHLDDGNDLRRVIWM